MLSQYATALRGNLSSSMQVKAPANHLRMGKAAVGGNPDMPMGSSATWGPSVKHTTDSKGLSLLEAAMRTPRYTKMNEELAAMRVSSPGMNGVLCESIYGDQVSCFAGSS